MFDQMFALVKREIRETLERPSRLLAVFSLTRIGRYIRFQRLRFLAGGEWSDHGGGVASKGFSSYEDYVRVQQSKLQYLDLSAHEGRFRKVLAQRLAASALVSRGARVLCLGARLGAEVAAFRDVGTFAVGVDLNPGKDNPWVMFGDFHNLEYPDAIVDIVYSNSLDHSFDLARVLAEVRRLLTDFGHLIVEADPGVEESSGVAPDLWAAFQWPTVTALADRIRACGFELVERSNFDYPRGGTCLVFQKRLDFAQK